MSWFENVLDNGGGLTAQLADATSSYQDVSYLNLLEVVTMTEHTEDRMIKWFKFDHLPESLKEVSFHFAELASTVCLLVEPGPERTVALRKLLEAKDAAVRARLHPKG